VRVTASDRGSDRVSLRNEGARKKAKGKVGRKKEELSRRGGDV